MYYRIKLSKKEALEVLEKGDVLISADQVDESIAYGHFNSFERESEFGIAMFRGEPCALEDNFPQYNINLKKEDTYYTNVIIEGREEEALQALAEEELRQDTSAFACLDHDVSVGKDYLQVGCQYITKKEALDIAKYITNLWG